MTKPIETIQDLSDFLADLDGQRNATATFGKMTFKPSHEKRTEEIISMARENGALILYTVESRDSDEIVWVRFSFEGPLGVFRWMLNEINFIGAPFKESNV